MAKNGQNSCFGGKNGYICANLAIFTLFTGGISLLITSLAGIGKKASPKYYSSPSIIVNTVMVLIIGPSDVGGECPTPSYKYGHGGKDFCCCGNACCFHDCKWSPPPENCLQGVPSAKWIYNQDLGYYQAFRPTTGENFSYILHEYIYT